MEILSILAILLSTLLASLFIVVTHRRRRCKLPPGPRPLPIIGNLHQIGSLPHHSFHNLSKTYGPIMFLHLGTKPTVVISSPAAAELVLKTHDHVFSGRPRLRVIEEIVYGNKGMAFVDSGTYWQSIRKLCRMQLLSASKVEFFAPMRRGEVRRLVESVRAARGLVDVNKEVGRLMGDIACRMILGCGTEERYNLKPLIHEALSLTGTFNLADYLPFLESLDLQGINRRAKAVHQAIDKVLEEILIEHEQDTSGKYKGDFVDTLLSNIDQPINNLLNDESVYILERSNIKAILLEMIEASYDTPSITIEWALSELMKNPRSMRLLQKELEAVVGMDRAVEESDLPKLPYLDMVVKENFRLHPPGPLLIQHKCRDDIEVSGYHIPKDTRVMINVWAIARDTGAWSNNAEEFLPERFAESGVDVKGRDFQLLPFGSGRRICPGINLGLLMTKLVLAQLVHCFYWELPNGMSLESLDMTEEFGLTVAKANHLVLVPKYRLLV